MDDSSLKQHLISKSMFQGDQLSHIDHVTLIGSFNFEANQMSNAWELAALMLAALWEFTPA